MIYRTTKFFIWLVFACVVLNVSLAVLTNVSTNITDSDEAVFRTIFDNSKAREGMSYDQEIELIKSTQALVLSKAPYGEQISEYTDREPENLFQKQGGLCHDRSRTYDKVFKWLGFETRHLYILYPEHPVTRERLSYLQAIFTKGTNSHAVTEVKTSRGWLVVDSNLPWISVTEDGSPVDADHIFERLNQFMSIPGYWKRPYMAIRGLYSRRGQFYRPYIPYPQLNWYDFVSWLIIG